jgi:DNA-binding NarL/FixJ family response regulator
MRVLLADDHSQVRWALRAVIREEPSMIIVAEVSDAAGLLAEVQATRPDLLLLEWDLPGRAVSELLPEMRALGLPFRVIVLSRRPEVEKAALVAGADAFVNKATGPEQLLNLLRELVHSGTQRATA